MRDYVAVNWGKVHSVVSNDLSVDTGLRTCVLHFSKCRGISNGHGPLEACT